MHVFFVSTPFASIFDKEADRRPRGLHEVDKFDEARTTLRCCLKLPQETSALEKQERTPMDFWSVENYGNFKSRKEKTDVSQIHSLKSKMIFGSYFLCIYGMGNWSFSSGDSQTLFLSWLLNQFVFFFLQTYKKNLIFGFEKHKTLKIKNLGISLGLS